MSKADEVVRLYRTGEAFHLFWHGMSMQRELRHQMYNGSCVGAEII